MKLTRIDAEKILARRCGSKMTAADMDGTTVDGTNQDVIDPLVSSMLTMGYEPASIADVTDDDLSAIPPESINQLIDRAELQLLKNIAGNLTLIDITAGPRKESLSQLSEFVEKQISRTEAKIERQYGTSDTEGGAIDFDFQE